MDVFEPRHSQEAKSQLFHSLYEQKLPQHLPLGSFKIYHLKSTFRWRKILDDKDEDRGSYLMSYECRRGSDRKKNDSLTVKTVYIIPSYIFSHMIVHMLGILNGNDVCGTSFLVAGSAVSSSEM